MSRAEQPLLRPPGRHLYAAISVVIATALCAACSPTPATDDGTLMRAGLEMFYTQHDPAAAAVQFRQVLTHTPAHYGATYQLAAALDAAGKPAEARGWWTKMLALATAQNDVDTAATARARLAEADVVRGDTSAFMTEAAVMQAGIEAFYTRHDAAAAVALFRQVVTRNPTHYGATYQLAAALDAAGRPQQARVVWEKVLEMAEHEDDGATAATARTRLAQPDVESPEAVMQSGLEALYSRHDPAAAAAAFRKVLAHMPTHYGAQYQLAAALDAAGTPEQARPEWAKVLALAEAQHDQGVAAEARKHLSSDP